jgi:hypothetical protein
MRGPGCRSHPCIQGRHPWWQTLLQHCNYLPKCLAHCPSYWKKTKPKQEHASGKEFGTISQHGKRSQATKSCCRQSAKEFGPHSKPSQSQTATHSENAQRNKRSPKLLGST